MGWGSAELRVIVVVCCGRGEGGCIHTFKFYHKNYSKNNDLHNLCLLTQTYLQLPPSLLREERAEG